MSKGNELRQRQVVAAAADFFVHSLPYFIFKGPAEVGDAKRLQANSPCL